MSLLKLEFPVFTLEQKELLPVGTLLTEQVMAEVAALGQLEVRGDGVLLDYGTVRADLERFLVIPPYGDIFSDAALVARLMQTTAAVRLPVPLLQALDYFRQHDFHTYRHILMVFALSTMLSPSAGNTEAGQSLAGPTHDFGKICIPLPVLKKTSPLTAQERRMLDHHPLAGYVLMSYYLKDHRHPAALVARDHHERRNGTGYPRGLTELHPLAELVAVCDIYDALISPRPYRPLSFDNRTALEELTVMAERGDIGWDGVTALVALNRGRIADPTTVEVSRDKRGTPPVGNCYGLLANEESAVVADPRKSLAAIS